MKKGIRKTILEKRLALSNQEYREKSEIICEKLISHPIIQEASTIHIYYPVKNEVDVRPFIEMLWNSGKRVIMPRVDFSTKEMENFFVISFGQLEETRYGLYEPRSISPLHLGSPDVVIVPGVAFSPDRQRLGYGGGFYDRFLSSVITTKIAPAFDLQIIPELPVMKHDQALDLIITETRII
jgi:5-formyltetrahydrofolate cyclo-ligase